MARKHEAADLLRTGCSPSNIAQQMGVTLDTVMGYLYNQVGEGRVKRSDIVFSIEERIRRAVEEVVSHAEPRDFGLDFVGGEKTLIVSRVVDKLANVLNQDEIEDAKIYLDIRDARVVLGDMYELLRDIELNLHTSMRDLLEAEHGQNDWWRRGVPENIRRECAATLEGDQQPADHPYCYTTLIHLKDILDKQWAVFTKVLPKGLSQDKKALLERLVRLNQIRNAVMHPVRGTTLTADDFAFVRDCGAYFQLPWRVGG